MDDGRVLVVGGMKDMQGVPECEIYDPSTEQWSLTDSLTPRRIANELCLLTDGKVLCSGGLELFADPGSSAVDRIDTYLKQQMLSGQGKRMTECQIFDPSTEQWYPTGSMTFDREYHVLVGLDNGDVLAVGDLNCIPECELFDYASETWSVTGSISPGRRSHACVKLEDGDVLLVGGFAGGGVFLEDCELYDPLTGQWTDTCAILPGRVRHSATLLDNGGVLVPGGAGSSGWLLDCQIYDDQSSIAEQKYHAIAEFMVTPNPFTKTTYIGFNLQKPEDIQISIFDVCGACVKKISRFYPGAGNHTFEWNGEDHTGCQVPAGTYFVLLETADTKRMTKVLCTR
jgi:hypothetical protein